VYVNRDGVHLDQYRVTCANPARKDMHPDNPDATGPVELRTLTYIQTYDCPELDVPTTGEMYATGDSVYFLGDTEGALYRLDLASGSCTQQLFGSIENYSGIGLSLLGYDEKNAQWYAANESRDVWRWDGTKWAFQFNWPGVTGGSHGDGFEIVLDANSGEPLMYISDMTADYIWQYALNETTGQWEPAETFQYTDAGNWAVEGMGFGCLDHFWVTTGFSSSGTLYELGGGRLSQFIDDDEPVVPEPATIGCLTLAVTGLGGYIRRRRTRGTL
jgi:hypothetical protein